MSQPGSRPLEWFYGVHISLTVALAIISSSTHTLRVAAEAIDSFAAAISALEAQVRSVILLEPPPSSGILTKDVPL